MPLEHLADRGSDNFARDLMIGILQGSEAELCDIDAALAKIDAGTYGMCESCHVDISKGRLKALPFARLCIKCKQAEERQAAAQ
jgi:RNA polymerase-binding transcription factor DksA